MSVTDPTVVPGLDEVAAHPERVADLTLDAQRTLVLRCATVLAALAGTFDASVTITMPRDEPERPPFTVPQAAAALNFAPSYVYELVRRGVLIAVRRGRHIRIRPTAITVPPDRTKQTQGRRNRLRE